MKIINKIYRRKAFWILFFITIILFYFIYISSDYYKRKKIHSETVKEIEKKLMHNEILYPYEFSTIFTHYMMNRKYKRALEIAQNFVLSYPKNPVSYATLVLYFITMENIDKSYKIYSKEMLKKLLLKGKDLLRNEKDFFICQDYGYLFENLGFLNEALECYKLSFAKYKNYNIKDLLNGELPDTKEKIRRQFLQFEDIIQKDIERCENKLKRKN